MLSESNGTDLSPILIKSSLLLGPARSKSGFREALWIPQKQAQKKPPPFPKPPPPRVPSPDTIRHSKEGEFPLPALPLSG